MIRSLRIRLMLGAAALAVLFMLALLPALQRAFGIALENTIEHRQGGGAEHQADAQGTDHRQRSVNR